MASADAGFLRVFLVIIFGRPKSGGRFKPGDNRPLIFPRFIESFYHSLGRGFLALVQIKNG